MSEKHQGYCLTRRNFCMSSAGLLTLGPLALQGCGGDAGVGSSGSTVGTAQTVSSSESTPRSFVHPGLLHTEVDFERMRVQVQAGAEPWLSGWNKFLNTGRSHLNTSPRPLQTVVRGGTGSNYAQLYIDIARTYQLAVRWKVSGDTACADKAVEFLNAWANNLTLITGNADRFLAAGIYGYQFANAAEIMRTYSGYAAADFKKFQDMMLTVFYPLSHDFLINHNNANITNYWANWDQCNLASILAIGVLCDREDLYNEALSYYKTGLGNGAALRAVYYVHPGYLGQWQESGRDQGHTTLGVGLAASFCEMAWNQGDDLYGYDNNRLLAGAEYVAKSNLSDAKGNGYYTTMPFAVYRNILGTHTVISNAGLPFMRPVWSMIYNHYVNRLGISAPYCEAMISAIGPEGDGGNGDQLGVGTLTFSRTPEVSNPKPSGLTARLVDGQVQLSWWGVPKATSYTLKRSNMQGGPYIIVADSLSGLLSYTDTGLPSGRYYYVVTAQTPAGETEISNEATVLTGKQLHTHFTFEEVSDLVVTDVSGNGHNGTLINGPVLVSGKQGNAMSFDGVNDYMELPTGAVQDLSDFTIATWVYWNAARTWERIFDFGSNTGYYMMLTPRAGDGKARFAITTAANYGESVIASTAALPTGRWVHVAVTLSGSTGTLYIDGSAVGSSSNIPLAPFRLGVGAQHWIGRSQYADPYFNGKIDDFRIYNGALSATEVLTLAQS
jgi:hypothetical protein